MRGHCRSQHNYEPMPFDHTKPPSSVGVKTGFSTPEKDTGLTIAIGKLQKIMRDVIIFEQLASGQTATPGSIIPMLSPESAINHMLDNYLIVRKKEIEGISGYVCKDCLTFQFCYIKDIGSDLTAKERHRCRPAAVSHANGLKNRVFEQNSLQLESVGYLAMLTDLVFGDQKYVTVSDSEIKLFETNISSIQEFKIGGFHAPVFRLDTITPEHWAWAAIHHRTLPLKDDGLRTILSNVRGTYAVISIQKGTYAGPHLLSISN